ncbi:exonuclease SbcCD subunit D [Calidifontibacter terrae]
MRLLHTSDWHLGRSFHGVGLLSAQRDFVDHLVQVVRDRQVDVVLVSGDVYDRALPAPDTVDLLDHALVSLLATGAQVVVSSGNHDSARRLGFGSRLLSQVGLHLATSIDQIGEPVLVGDTAIYPIPYLEPSVAAEPLGAARATHAAVLRAAMDRIRADHAGRADQGVRMVVMAHSFVAGATTSQSERDVTVGGLGVAPVEIFDGADYVALGHLHRAQEVRPGVRYSGSPIAFSFSETGDQKTSVLVDLDTGLQELIPTPVPRPLARLRGELEELLDDPDLADHEQAWCEVTLTDAVHPVSAMDRIRSRFPHTLALLFDSPARPGDDLSYVQRLRERADLDVCCDFVDHVRRAPADADETALLKTALADVDRQRASRDDEGIASHAGVA